MTYKFHETEQPTSNPFGQLLGEYYYISLENDERTKAWIARSHIDDFENWENIYTVSDDQTDGANPNPQSYNLWVDPSTGDEILVFQHRMALPSRVDIEAWNITQQKTEWKYEDIGRLKNSNHQQIRILRDKAYFMAGASLICFDIASGEILWEYVHPSGVNGFMLRKMAYCEDLDLLIHKDASTLLAFDPDNGKVYRNDSAGSSDVAAGSPTCFDGILYYTATQDLYAHDASNGDLLWEEESKLHLSSHFNGEVAIDEEEKVLYAADRYYLYAIKTYEE